jgi:hypothetical protein
MGTTSLFPMDVEMVVEKDVEMVANSATDAQKWSDAINKNIKFASDDE